MNAFAEDQLVKKTTSFYELIKKLKLLTFSKLKKSVKSKIQDKIVQLTAEKNIFGRITTVRQQRNIEMKKNLCYPLGPIPWALTDSMSTLKKTNKAILMHELEKHAEPNEKVLSHSCTITDMPLAGKIGNAGLTYEEFALKLLNAAMSSGCSSSREDVVFDECYEISIKTAERAQRKSGNLEFKKTVSSQLKKNNGTPSYH